MKDLKEKLYSFINRILRYFVFSTLLSIFVSALLMILNVVMGVWVSIGFYSKLFARFDLGLTLLISLYHFERLFVPINKPLIRKLEQEKVERARRAKTRRNKKIS